MTTQRSKKQLRQASNHVMYELWMLNEVAVELGTNTKLTMVQKNALLESFLVHARALEEFLFRMKRRRKDDVVAEDYFDNKSAWEKRRGRKGQSLYRYKLSRPSGKQALHLTYARIKKKKEWPIHLIVFDINKAFRVFLGCVPRDRLSNVLVRFETEYNGLFWHGSK